MGRVFTSEELINDHLPEPQDFADAAESILQTFTAGRDGLTSASAAIGALIFGSTSTETTTVRSDLDIVVAFDDRQYSKSAVLLWYRTLFRSVRHRFGVPVESTIESVANLRDGNHSIDDIFLDTLRDVPAEWSAGLNPAILTAPQHKDWLSVFKEYAIAKDRKLGKALTDTPDIDTKAMQRALELPVALGRKALSVLTKKGLVDINATGGALPKSAVIQHLEKLDPPQSIIEPLSRLVKIDGDYTQLVGAIMANTSSPKDHQQWLEGHYVPALTTAIDYNSRLSQHVIDLTAE